MSYSTELHFVTYITVEPNRSEINNYLSTFTKTLLIITTITYPIFGPHGPIHRQRDNLPWH